MAFTNFFKFLDEATAKTVLPEYCPGGTWLTDITDPGLVIYNNSGVLTSGFHINIYTSQESSDIEGRSGYLGTVDDTGLLLAGTAPVVPKYLFCGSVFPIPVALPGWAAYVGDYFENAMGPSNGDLQYTINAGLDGALFTLTNNVLKLPSQSAGTYSVSLRATSTSTGTFTDATYTVQMKSLAAGSAVRYIRPNAAGLADGTSWANAAALSQLNAMAAAVSGRASGGIVYLGADQGSYTAAQTTLSHGGGVGAAQVQILGVDTSLNPMNAVINGTRTPFVPPPNPETPTSVHSWNQGSTLWYFGQGANNIIIKNIAPQNLGAFTNRNASCHGVTVDSCVGFNIERMHEESSGVCNSNWTFSNTTMGGYSKQAIRIRGQSYNFTLSNLAFNSMRQDLDGAGFAVGCQISEFAHDISATDCSFINSYYSGTAFYNGDGLSTEDGNYNITLTRVSNTGNSDSGIDTKGSSSGANIVMNSCTSGDNCIGIKFWADNIVYNDLYLYTPHSRGGSGTQFFVECGDSYLLNVTNTTFNNLKLRGGTSSPATWVFYNGKDRVDSTKQWNITVNGWDIQIDPEVTLLGANANNGQAPLPVVTWTPAIPVVSTAGPTWRTGFEGGVIDQPTAIYTDIADLSGTGTGLTGALLFRLKSGGSYFAITGGGTVLTLVGTLDPAVATSYSCTILAYDPSGLASKLITVTAYINATTVSPNTQTWLNTLAAHSLPAPQRRWRSAYDNYIRALSATNSGNNWAKRDVLMSTVSYDSGVAKINIKQDAFNATWNGTPSWTKTGGWVGNGTDAYITFGLTPSTFGGQYSQNSGHMFFSKTTNDAIESVMDMGIDTPSTTRSRLIAHLTSDLYSFGIQSPSAGSTANTHGIGDFGVNRIISASYKRFLNVTSGTTTSTSAAIPAGVLTMGHAANAVTGFTTGGYTFASFGGGFSDEQTEFLAWRTANAQFLAQAAVAE